MRCARSCVILTLPDSTRLEMLAFLFLAGLFSSTWASLNLHDGPLLPPATAYTFELTSTVVTKPTSCYITSGIVSECRRKRGMEERPQIIQFDDDLEVAPSVVLPMETTAVPRTINSLGMFSGIGNHVFSSIDELYFNTPNIFNQLAAKSSNLITVGDCGQSTVNLLQFLSCLGLTVQETTTLTGTFRRTETVSTGYTIMTVLGCTPAGFPYTYCPPDAIETASAPSMVNLKPSMAPSVASRITNPSLRRQSKPKNRL